MSRKHNKGITFVEILIVIAIMAVLVAILIPTVFQQVERTKMQKDDSALSELVNSVQLALANSDIYDEASTYCIKNNYMTYTDSSGVFGRKATESEYWAPDGSAPAMTITLNPVSGNYVLGKGIINDMTYGNGSVGEERIIDGEIKQCQFKEMELMFPEVQRCIGMAVPITSRAYSRSSYTIFILFDTDARKASVSGSFNGVYLSSTSPAAIVEGTEINVVIGQDTGRPSHTQEAIYTASDLRGTGTISSTPPSYKPVCKYNTYPSETYEWQNTSASTKFIQDGKLWTCSGSSGSTSWKVTPEVDCDATIRYFTSCDNIYDTTLSLRLNNTEIAKIQGNTKGMSYTTTLKAGVTYTLAATYSKSLNTRPSIDKRDCAIVYLDTIVPKEVVHRCELHEDEEHVFTRGTTSKSTCKNGGTTTYKCKDCDITVDVPAAERFHTYNTAGYCVSCGELAWAWIPYTFSCQDYESKTGKDLSDNEEIIIPKYFQAIDGKVYCVTSIGKSAFINRTKLKKVVFQGDLTSIPEKCFSGCTALESFKVPEGVTTIGKEAFSNCTNLSNVKLPDSLKTIDTYGFYKCSSLETIEFPKNLEKISASSFMYTALSSVTIPKSVTSVSYDSFKQNPNLKEIRYEQGATTVFMACDIENLETIYIPNSVTTITRNAFERDYKIKHIYFDGTPEQWEEIKNAEWGFNVSTRFVHCGNGTTWSCYRNSTPYEYCSIHNPAPSFEVLPAGLYDADNNMVDTWEEFNGYCHIEDAASTTESLTTKYRLTHNFNGYKWTPTTKIKIGSNITKIGMRAFMDCTQLTDIVLPNTINTIGQSAFYKCGITTMVIPEGVTELSSWSFGYCESLTKITLPKSLTNLSAGCLSGCTSLTEIVFNGSEAEWDAIYKSGSWRTGVPADCVIRCIG